MKKIGWLAIQNMNSENVQHSSEDRGHLTFQNINTENVKGSIENRGPLAIENIQPLAVEDKRNYCTLCTTPTYCLNF